MRLRYHLRSLRTKRKCTETWHPLPIIMDCYGLTMMKYSKSLCWFGKICLNQQRDFDLLCTLNIGITWFIKEPSESANKIPKCKQQKLIALLLDRKCASEIWLHENIIWKLERKKFFNADFSRKNQYFYENIHSILSIILDKNWFCGYYIEKGADLNGDYNKREHSQSSECL